MRYEVILTRTVVSSAAVEISAHDEDAAEQKAEEMSAGAEWQEESDTIQVDSIDELENA